MNYFRFFAGHALSDFIVGHGELACLVCAQITRRASISFVWFVVFDFGWFLEAQWAKCECFMNLRIRKGLRY